MTLLKDEASLCSQQRQINAPHLINIKRPSGVAASVAYIGNLGRYLCAGLGHAGLTFKTLKCLTYKMIDMEVWAD